MPEYIDQPSLNNPDNLISEMILFNSKKNRKHTSESALSTNQMSKNIFLKNLFGRRPIRYPSKQRDRKRCRLKSGDFSLLSPKMSPNCLI